MRSRELYEVYSIWFEKPEATSAATTQEQVYMPVYTHTHTYTHTPYVYIPYVCMYIYTHTHTHTYTHTYTGDIAF